MKLRLGRLGSTPFRLFIPRDYDRIPRALDFVFTVSNFRLCVVNLQPLEESFEVSSLRSSYGVSSLDFGPASCGAFFASHSGDTRHFFLASYGCPSRRPIGADRPIDSEKRSQSRQITRNAF